MMKEISDVESFVYGNNLKEKIEQDVGSKYQLGATISTTITDTILLLVSDMVDISYQYTEGLSLSMEWILSDMTMNEYKEDVYDNTVKEGREDPSKRAAIRFAEHGLRLKKYMTKDTVAMQDDFGREITILLDLYKSKGKTLSIQESQQILSNALQDIVTTVLSTYQDKLKYNHY